jgi:hypothetical protein
VQIPQIVAAADGAKKAESAGSATTAADGAKKAESAVTNNNFCFYLRLF